MYGFGFLLTSPTASASVDSGDTSHMVAMLTRGTGIIAHQSVTFTLREGTDTTVTIDAGKLFSKKIKKVLDRT